MNASSTPRCSLVPVLAVALATALPAPGQETLPQARLLGLFPGGSQRGATVEVEISGPDLDGVSTIEFSNPGISGTLIDPGIDEFEIPRAIEGRRFSVTVAEDVGPGVYEARVRGRFGISNPAVFVVGDVPEVVVVEANHSPESATMIARPGVIHGRIEDNQVDHFRFSAKRGDRVTFACWAERIGSRADPVIEVRDSKGRVLGRSNNAIGRDAAVTVPIPADGDYLVVVFDGLFDGGADYVYRLECDAGPVPVSVFPGAVRRGTEERFEVVGFGLPAPRGAARLSSEGWGELMLLPIAADDAAEGTAGAVLGLPLPAGEVGQRSLFHPAGAGGVRSPWGVPLLVTDHPVTLEREPNGGFDQATSGATPLVMGGRFDRAGDIDVVAFDVAAGQPLWIEVFSDRLGAPTDPFVTVFRLRANEETGGWNAERLGEADDIDQTNPVARASVRCRDAAYRLELGEAARCAVVIENRYESGGADCGYVLSVAPPSPNFELVVACERPFVDDRKLEQWAGTVSRGGSLRVDVAIRRQQGFDGAVSLAMEGLPDGLNCTPTVIPVGENAGQLIVSHDGSALPEGWTGAVRVVGGAVGGGGEQALREARVAVLDLPVTDSNLQRTIVRDAGGLVIALQSADSAPLAFVLGDPSATEVPLGGRIDVPVKLTSVPAEPKGDVKLVATGIPGMRKPPEMTIKAGETEGTFTIPFEATNENPLRSGECDLVIRAEAVFVHRANQEAEARWKAETERLNGLASAAEEAAKKLEGDVAAAGEDGAAELKQALETKKREIEALNGSRQRVEQFLKSASERAKPTDRRTAAFSRPLRIKITEPPKSE